MEGPCVTANLVSCCSHSCLFYVPRFAGAGISADDARVCSSPTTVAGCKVELFMSLLVEMTRQVY